jgi:hypothetical protein
MSNMISVAVASKLCNDNNLSSFFWRGNIGSGCYIPKSGLLRAKFVSCLGSLFVLVLATKVRPVNKTVQPSCLTAGNIYRNQQPAYHGGSMILIVLVIS